MLAKTITNSLPSVKTVTDLVPSTNIDKLIFYGYYMLDFLTAQQNILNKPALEIEYKI